MSLLLLRTAVGLAVGAAWVASAAMKSFGTTPPTLQPHPTAFAIWLLIFSSLVAVAPYMQTARSAVSVLASLVFATAWTLAFPDAPRVATATIGASAAAAWVGVAVARHAAVRVAVGLYAGWLSVATLLNLAIVAPRVFDRPPALAAAAALVAAASIRLGEPAPSAAVAWAAAWQMQRGRWEWGACVFALLGIAGGAARF